LHGWSLDPSADRQRRESIEQRIEAYSAAGSITDSQMQELQAEIAKLDEASRRQMMSKLVRALNSGDIKGRL
jgi:multidrug resistance efflux pump